MESSKTKQIEEVVQVTSYKEESSLLKFGDDITKTTLEFTSDTSKDSDCSIDIPPGMKWTSDTPCPDPPKLSNVGKPGGHTYQQQEYIDYGWRISGGQLRFIHMLAAENGSINPHNQSTFINKYNRREPSWGFCQIHKPSHPDVYEGTIFWDDWKWQMRKCLELYEGGTVFYAINRFDNDPAYRADVLSKFE